MDSREFTNLYAKQNYDEAITSFQNEAGFSLIRFYPESTPYHKDGRRMFMKVAALDRGFFYGVDMTKPEKRGEATDYVITDGTEYRKKVTNFISNGGEFTFDEEIVEATGEADEKPKKERDELINSKIRTSFLKKNLKSLFPSISRIASITTRSRTFSRHTSLTTRFGKLWSQKNMVDSQQIRKFQWRTTRN